jgi:hypothetical protein
MSLITELWFWKKKKTISLHAYIILKKLLVYQIILAPPESGSWRRHWLQGLLECGYACVGGRFIRHPARPQNLCLLWYLMFPDLLKSACGRFRTDLISSSLNVWLYGSKESLYMLLFARELLIFGWASCWWLVHAPEGRLWISQLGLFRSWLLNVSHFCLNSIG